MIIIKKKPQEKTKYTLSATQPTSLRFSSVALRHYFSIVLPLKYIIFIN